MRIPIDHRLPMIGGLALLLAGCPEAPQPTFEQCELEATAEPSLVAPGDAVVVTGGPFSQPYDTSVRFGGTRAEVLDVTRTACDDCDACVALSDADCSECEVCVECLQECASCVETVTFEVPDLAPGPWQAVIDNAFGTSPPLSFEVVASDTADPGDTDTTGTSGDGSP